MEEMNFYIKKNKLPIQNAKVTRCQKEAKNQGCDSTISDNYGKISFPKKYEYFFFQWYGDYFPYWDLEIRIPDNTQLSQEKYYHLKCKTYGNHSIPPDLMDFDILLKYPSKKNEIIYRLHNERFACIEEDISD
jgi:hypothetical protein